MKYASKRKKVLVGALVACVVAIMATGSLAYLTYNDTAINTFHVDERESVEVGDFSIALYENWASSTGSGQGETGGADFGAVKPGETVIKEPWVTNTSLEAHEAYVRLNVTVTNASHVATDYTADEPVVVTDGDAIVGTVMGMFGLDDGRGGFEAVEGWAAETEWNDGWTVSVAPVYDEAANTVNFSLIYDEAIAQNVDTPAAFQMLKMPRTLAGGDAFKLFQVNLSADAISATDIVDEFGEDETIGFDVNEAADAFAFMAAEPRWAETA